jgi:N-acetylmuramoyl-L-alanine amidase
MPVLRYISAAVLTVMLVACQSPSPPSRHSTYGDKPGPQGFNTVILDAGHGGHDSGARARGLVEKQLALDVTKRVRSELWPGYKVVLMRDSDNFVDLDRRVAIANRYPNAILVSIHFNYGRRNRAGPETYYWRSDSYALAKRVQRNLSAVAPYERNNAGLTRRRLRLTRNPSIPCILVECGYLTHASEARLVSSPAYREKLADAIAKAIRDQSRLGDSGMGPIPKPIYAPPSRAGDARG